MSVELRPITRAIWRESAKLELAEEQRRFVATNAMSIAESRFEPTWEPMAIYADDVMVGFILWGQDTDVVIDNGEWWIIRLMIAQPHQRKGYGRAATVEAIRMLRAKPNCRDILLSFVPDNRDARALYESLGFVDTGRVEMGETVYRLEPR